MNFLCSQFFKISIWNPFFCGGELWKFITPITFWSIYRTSNRQCLCTLSIRHQNMKCIMRSPRGHFFKSAQKYSSLLIQPLAMTFVEFQVLVWAYFLRIFSDLSKVFWDFFIFQILSRRIMFQLPRFEKRRVTIFVSKRSRVSWDILGFNEIDTFKWG